MPLFSLSLIYTSWKQQKVKRVHQLQLYSLQPNTYMTTSYQQVTTTEQHSGLLAVVDRGAEQLDRAGAVVSRRFDAVVSYVVAV